MESVSLVDELLEEAAWKGKDEFPSTKAWRADLSRLLEFFKEQKQLGRLWPALTSERPRQRNSALAEGRAAQFLVAQGCEITDWQPKLENGRTPEFEIRTPDGDRVMVEVKGTDWQAELSVEERKAGRALEPKNKHAEVRTSTTMKHVEAAILKAGKQLPGDQSTLVVIVDDLYWSPADKFPANVLVPALKKFFGGGVARNVGGVLFLNAVKLVSEKEVALRVRFVPNENCDNRCQSQDLEKTLRPFTPEF
jgi:hypothetical protein